MAGPAVYPTTAPAAAPKGPKTTNPEAAPKTALPARSWAWASHEKNAPANAAAIASFFIAVPFDVPGGTGFRNCGGTRVVTNPSQQEPGHRSQIQPDQPRTSGLSLGRFAALIATSQGAGTAGGSGMKFSRLREPSPSPLKTNNPSTVDTISPRCRLMSFSTCSDARRSRST